MSGANLKAANETRAAIKRYNDWEKAGRPPVKIFKKKETVKISPDEKIVPLYDYSKGKPNRKYRVTESGKLLSFVNNNPYVLSGSLDKEDYIVIELGKKRQLKLGRIVWYSFAADRISTGEKLEDLISWNPNGKKLEDYVGTKKQLYAGKCDSIIDIHHKDGNNRNNRIDNLEPELLSKGKDFHQRLEGLKKVKANPTLEDLPSEKDFIDFADKFSEYPIQDGKSIIAVSTDTEKTVQTIDTNKLMKDLYDCIYKTICKMRFKDAPEIFIAVESGGELQKEFYRCSTEPPELLGKQEQIPSEIHACYHKDSKKLQFKSGDIISW